MRPLYSSVLWLAPTVAWWRGQALGSQWQSLPGHDPICGGQAPSSDLALSEKLELKWQHQFLVLIQQIPEQLSWRSFPQLPHVDCGAKSSRCSPPAVPFISYRSPLITPPSFPFSIHPICTSLPSIYLSSPSLVWRMRRMNRGRERVEWETGVGWIKNEFRVRTGFAFLLPCHGNGFQISLHITPRRYPVSIKLAVKCLRNCLWQWHISFAPLCNLISLSLPPY